MVNSKIKPITGAALYEAFGKEIWMTCTDGYQSVIDVAKTSESAIKRAETWQRRENKAVLKSNSKK